MALMKYYPNLANNSVSTIMMKIDAFVTLTLSSGCCLSQFLQQHFWLDFFSLEKERLAACGVQRKCFATKNKGLGLSMFFFSCTFPSLPVI